MRTIERLLENHSEEMYENGYEIFKFNRLRNLRKAFSEHLEDVPDIHVGDMSQLIDDELVAAKAPSMGIFTFKSVFNIGMLLTGSARARQVRSAILNIVIDVMNKRLGGSTKFINQREEEFLPSALREYNYRKIFTDALDRYIQPNKFNILNLQTKFISVFSTKSQKNTEVFFL